MSARTKLGRVTDLFRDGHVLDLGPDDEGKPITLWVKKPNSFDQAEIRKSASIARDMTRLRLGESSVEVQTVTENMATYPSEQLIEGVLSQFDSQFVTGAREDVDALEDFQDELAQLRAFDEAKAEGIEPTDEQVEERAKLEAQWVSHYTEQLEARRAAKIEEFTAMGRNELEAIYLDAYRTLQGAQSYAEQYQLAMIFRCVRDCQATKTDDGEWAHLTCNHSRFLFDTPAEVRQQSDEFLGVLTDAVNREAMGEQDAGKSDAPASSSAPSEQPSAEAASETPSGQVA